MPYLMPPTIRLADHVRACQVGKQVILLDLQRSKYIGIACVQALLLAGAIAGQPAPQPELPMPAEPSTDDPALRRLLDERVLTEQAPSTKVLPRLPLLPTATTSLNADEGDAPPSFRLRHC